MIHILHLSFVQVLPIFLLIMLGYAVRRLRLVDDHFIAQANRVLYFVCLPLLLFYLIATCDLYSFYNFQLLLGSTIPLVIVILISFAYTKLYGLSPAAQGSFIQTTFRGNIVYIAFALIYSLYGEEALRIGSILLAFLGIIVNFLSVLSFVVPNRHQFTENIFANLLRSVLINPIIISCMLGVLGSLVRIPMPEVLDNTFQFISNMTLPLALLVIGSSFSFQNIRDSYIQPMIASLVKLLVLPGITALFLAWFDLEPMYLAVGVIAAAAPTASISCIFARQFGGDVHFANAVVMLSTGLSLLTYPLIIFLLRTGWVVSASN